MTTSDFNLIVSFFEAPPKKSDFPSILGSLENHQKRGPTPSTKRTHSFVLTLTGSLCVRERAASTTADRSDFLSPGRVALEGHRRAVALPHHASAIDSGEGGGRRVCLRWSPWDQDITSQYRSEARKTMKHNIEVKQETP